MASEKTRFTHLSTVTHHAPSGFLFQDIKLMSTLVGDITHTSLLKLADSGSLIY